MNWSLYLILQTLNHFWVVRALIFNLLDLNFWLTHFIHTFFKFVIDAIYSCSHKLLDVKYLFLEFRYKVRLWFISFLLIFNWFSYLWDDLFYLLLPLLLCHFWTSSFSFLLHFTVLFLLRFWLLITQHFLEYFILSLQSLQLRFMFEFLGLQYTHSSF